MRRIRGWRRAGEYAAVQVVVSRYPETVKDMKCQDREYMYFVASYE